MTPQQQRIALASWYGIERIQTSHITGKLFGYKIGRTDSDGQVSIPDYLHDLNAVHELEEKLTNFQRWAFSDTLRLIINPHERTDDYTLIHATASQRCEALLRTLNLWKD